MYPVTFSHNFVLVLFVCCLTLDLFAFRNLIKSLCGPFLTCGIAFSRTLFSFNIITIAAVIFGTWTIFALCGYDSLSENYWKPFITVLSLSVSCLKSNPWKVLIYYTDPSANIFYLFFYVCVTISNASVISSTSTLQLTMDYLRGALGLIM